ncbi:hypothetical protein [Streptosporangium roseum]|uniref:hypothetical protein n=1 Tax=Streptosporangium roseum TaxID=2001 RepID=UPI0033313B87
MARSSEGSEDLVKIVQDLRDRVRRLELLSSVRAVSFVTQSSSASSSTFARMAWSSFPRSGSSLTVDVSVTLSGAANCELQLRADGTQIGAATVTSSGTVTLQGFLPEAWVFGARKVVEVQAKVPGGSAAIAVVGAWHQ